ncbi:hypothetical protein ACQ4M3_07910 [Leptolyngbya sp. AN03gr2]|uniref:hypothetical protein n=1 Tax=unclassified Leptolyngbya TaxID=2650499 RepID=UPI003D324290
MPQYKLTFRSQDKDHIYIRFGKTETEAKNFTPLKVVDSDHSIPLNGKLVDVDEMEVWAVFQLNPSTYKEVKEIAESQELSAEKADGSYCLKVKGKGDWIKLDWVKSYTILSSNWIYSKISL